MATSESNKKAHYKYEKENLKRIPLDVRKEKYARIKESATKVGESVNGYIKKSVLMRMEKDNEQ